MLKSNRFSLWWRTYYHRRHPPMRTTDPEAARRRVEEPVNIHAIDKAAPSYAYGKVRSNMMHAAARGSTQSQSAEVWYVLYHHDDGQQNCLLISSRNSAICLEVFVHPDHVRRLQCSHIFHSSCIDSWFQGHHTDCPLCKSIFIPNT